MGQFTFGQVIISALENEQKMKEAERNRLSDEEFRQKQIELQQGGQKLQEEGLDIQRKNALEDARRYDEDRKLKDEMNPVLDEAGIRNRAKLIGQNIPKDFEFGSNFKMRAGEFDKLMDTRLTFEGKMAYNQYLRDAHQDRLDKLTEKERQAATDREALADLLKSYDKGTIKESGALPAHKPFSMEDIKASATQRAKSFYSMEGFFDAVSQAGSHGAEDRWGIGPKQLVPTGKSLIEMSVESEYPTVTPQALEKQDMNLQELAGTEDDPKAAFGGATSLLKKAMGKNFSPGAGTAKAASTYGTTIATYLDGMLKGKYRYNEKEITNGRAILQQLDAIVKHSQAAMMEKSVFKMAETQQNELYKKQLAAWLKQHPNEPLPEELQPKQY